VGDLSINIKDVIRLLETIAIYMEIKGENTFKVSAFRKAAKSLETSGLTLEETTEFTSLPGIGKGTSAVIEEYIKEGNSTYFTTPDGNIYCPTIEDIQVKIHNEIIERGNYLNGKKNGISEKYSIMQNSFLFEKINCVSNILLMPFFMKLHIFKTNIIT